MLQSESRGWIPEAIENLPEDPYAVIALGIIIAGILIGLYIKAQSQSHTLKIVAGNYNRLGKFTGLAITVPAGFFISATRPQPTGFAVGLIFTVLILISVMYFTVWQVQNADIQQ